MILNIDFAHFHPLSAMSGWMDGDDDDVERLNR